MKLRINKIIIRTSIISAISANIILFVFSLPAFSNTKLQDSTKSIIIRQDEITPLDYLRGDTLRIDTNRAYNGGIPGAIGYYTTSQQDSNYVRALKINSVIPLSARLSNDLRQFSPLIPSKSDRTSMEDNARNALNLPPEFYMPSKVDVASYQYGLMMSQNYLTGIRVFNPFGLKIPLSSIGQFLGITEDVSPVIKYAIDYRVEVEILIYSVNAVAVATIYSGFQLPGKYTFTWNGRDDNGRRMPKGDYIAEVRIGKERYVRKRIVIQ